MEKQLVLVANAHMHWDPDYSDVKLVQTMMFLSEVKNIIDKASRSLKPGVAGELGTIPLVLCADLNSLPDSGKSTIPVVILLSDYSKCVTIQMLRSQFLKGFLTQGIHCLILQALKVLRK